MAKKAMQTRINALVEHSKALEARTERDATLIDAQAQRIGKLETELLTEQKLKAHMEETLSETLDIIKTQNGEYEKLQETSSGHYKETQRLGKALMEADKDKAVLLLSIKAREKSCMELLAVIKTLSKWLPTRIITHKIKEAEE